MWALAPFPALSLKFRRARRCCRPLRKRHGRVALPIAITSTPPPSAVGRPITTNCTTPTPATLSLNACAALRQFRTRCCRGCREPSCDTEYCNDTHQTNSSSLHRFSLPKSRYQLLSGFTLIAAQGCYQGASPLPCHQEPQGPNILNHLELSTTTTATTKEATATLASLPFALAILTHTQQSERVTIIGASPLTTRIHPQHSST